MSMQQLGFFLYKVKTFYEHSIDLAVKRGIKARWLDLISTDLEDPVRLQEVFHKSASMKLNQQVLFVYDVDGNAIDNIDKVVEGGSYVCSSLRKFIPSNYGSFGNTMSPGKIMICSW